MEAVTVYGELLRLALTREEEADTPLDDMVAEVLARREALARPGDSAARLAAALAYDSALVRLCRRVGVAHELTGELAGPQARRRAELALAEVVPTMHAALR